MTGFRGGRIRARRPRLRDKETGRELPLPGREEIGDGGCPEELVISPMPMNGQAGTFRGGVRLKEASAADDPGSGRSRSAVSRRHRCRPRWPRASPAVVEGPQGTKHHRSPARETACRLLTGAMPGSGAR